jgi:hypothetical protein
MSAYANARAHSQKPEIPQSADAVEKVAFSERGEIFEFWILAARPIESLIATIRFFAYARKQENFALGRFQQHRPIFCLPRSTFHV